MRVIESVAKLVKATVCKTVIVGSIPIRFSFYVSVGGKVNALDCGSRFYQFESGTPTYYWSNGRVVDCGSLLSCYSGNAIKSSNLFYSVFWLIRITVSSLGFHPSKTGSTPVSTF